MKKFTITFNDEEFRALEEGFDKSGCRTKADYLRSLIYGDARGINRKWSTEEFIEFFGDFKLICAKNGLTINEAIGLVTPND